MPEKRYYERNLPHWHPEGNALFITWRLYGSLPAEVVQAARDGGWASEGHKYRYVDSRLDKADCGPLWLRDERLAAMVVTTLRRGESELAMFRLYAFVVMANHVHVLIQPQAAVARIMRGIKRRTASLANEILRRKGQPFWQDESYDHWTRDEREFGRIWRYIEWNPVKAGLVKRPEDWPWSSASRSTGFS